MNGNVHILEFEFVSDIPEVGDKVTTRCGETVEFAPGLEDYSDTPCTKCITIGCSSTFKIHSHVDIVVPQKVQ